MRREFNPAAWYSLLAPGRDTPIGTVRRGVLTLTGEDDYAGVVLSNASPPYLWMRFGAPLGELDGLEIITPTAERLELRPIPRDANTRAQIDTDAYRALRDLAQVLMECNHPNAAQVLRIVRVAPFEPCPVCHDDFGRAEGCSGCGGVGFVPEA